ncbi:50S ribosomal protein L15 [Candidatus Shapirobacteria bacterium]|nr:50S ribosomal protein L15 [Candidatus Shapirobacteria bacterium]
MELNKLPKITKRAGKRVGRGRGSGKGGHTAGRGQKGQKVKEKIALLFEGTKAKKSLLKRLPLLPGKGKLKPRRKPQVVNLKFLNLFPANAEVTGESLAKLKIVDHSLIKTVGVKILGDGKLDVPLIVRLPCSKGARKKIETAGGKVITEDEKDS